MQLSARKSRGIDEVIGTMQPSVPETFRKPTNYSSPMNDLMKSYIDFLIHGPYDFLGKNECGEYKSQFYPQIDLKPDEIDTFLQATITCQGNPHYTDLTGDFVTELIRKSYQSGHIHFFLDTRNTPFINDIAQKLYADVNPYKTINLHIQGNVGRNLGSQGANLDITVYGNVDHNAGQLSRDCTFIIHGLANAVGVGSKRILMKTSNRRTYLDMVTVRKFSAKDCRGVAFIHPDGKEEWAR